MKISKATSEAPNTEMDIYLFIYYLQGLIGKYAFNK